MNDKTKALVLRIAPYKENDLLLQTLTKDYGVLSFVAKSAKKLSAKQHFFEGCVYEILFDYKENKTIFSLHNSKLLESYYDLNDMKHLSFNNILFEASLKSKEVIEEAAYDYLLEALKQKDNYLCSTLYLSYLCRCHGISPNTDECVVCSSKRVVSISNNLGGFVCLAHLNGLDTIDVLRLKKFRLISKAQLKDLKLIQDNQYDYIDFKLMMDFFIANSGIDNKAYEFFNQIL